MSMQKVDTAAPRVLIADDHPLYCDALRAVVPQACPGADMSEAASQEEVLGAVSGPRAFDLVLLDLNLPGAVGLSCLHALKHAAPATPIVVVSAVGDPEDHARHHHGGGKRLHSQVGPWTGAHQCAQSHHRGRNLYADRGARGAAQRRRRPCSRRADAAAAPRARAVIDGTVEQAHRARARHQRNHGEGARLGDLSKIGCRQSNAGGPRGAAASRAPTD